MSQVPPPPMPYQPQQAKESNVMAILSLVAGVPGMCVPLLGLVAIVLGALGISKARDPRVGGKGLAIAGLVLGIVGTVFSLLMISIALPALNTAREAANRMKCMSNLNVIGKGILLYANENGGAYPPDLATLSKTQDIELNVFVCPSSDDTVAADHASLHAGGHCTYVYVGKGKSTKKNYSASAVVAFEDPSPHGEGMNVLFEDGHVEFVSDSAAEKIRAQYGR